MVKAMSIKVGNPLRKLVLIKLADNASDAGECWPSHQHIADQCEVSKSTVRKHIKELSKQGFLWIEHRDGPKGNSSNMYHLSLNGMPAKDIGVPSKTTPMPSGSTPPVPSDDTRTSHSLEPVNEPVRFDYSEVENIYHECLPNAPKIAKLTDKRKKLIKSFFSEFNMDNEKLKNYFSFLNENENFKWLFETRSMNNGTNAVWQKKKIEYFLSEKCYLDAKEFE